MPDKISNLDLWKITNKKEIIIEIKKKLKCNWIGHMHTWIKEDNAVVKLFWVGILRVTDEEEDWKTYGR